MEGSGGKTKDGAVYFKQLDAYVADRVQGVPTPGDERPSGLPRFSGDPAVGPVRLQGAYRSKSVGAEVTRPSLALRVIRPA